MRVKVLKTMTVSVISGQWQYHQKRIKELAFPGLAIQKTRLFCFVLGRGGGMHFCYFTHDLFVAFFSFSSYAG